MRNGGSFLIIIGGENSKKGMIVCSIDNSKMKFEDMKKIVEEEQTLVSQPKIFVNEEKSPLPLPYFEELFVQLKLIIDEYLSKICSISEYDERIDAIVKSGKSVEFAQRIQRCLNEFFYNKIIGRIKLYCKQNGPIELE